MDCNIIIVVQHCIFIIIQTKKSQRFYDVSVSEILFSGKLRTHGIHASQVMHNNKLHAAETKT